MRPALRLTQAAMLGLLTLAAPACGEQKPAQATAQAGLPALTGRVVDGGALLSPRAEVALTQKLAAIEARTSDQFVVVTVPSLGGRSIEAFGRALGNGWGIGRKDLNNGVLLIVAPAERKVRIEVGFGLERILSDERAAQIIRDIAPKFSTGRMEEGIIAGADAIIATLQASPERKQRVAAS